MKTVWLLAKMALRNLRRNSRRTLLTVATISFGLSVLLWVECILEGRNKSIIEKITSGYVGHVQAYDHRFLKDHQLQFTMKKSPDGLEDLAAKGAVFARRVQVPSLISSGETPARFCFKESSRSTKPRSPRFANSSPTESTWSLPPTEPVNKSRS